MVTATNIIISSSISMINIIVLLYTHNTIIMVTTDCIADTISAILLLMLLMNANTIKAIIISIVISCIHFHTTNTINIAAQY